MVPESAASETFERVLALKRIPAFADLHPADLASLAVHAVPRRFPAGVTVPIAAEAGSVHFVIEGRVRPRNGRLVGAPLEAPGVLGLLDLLAGCPPPELATDTEVTTLEIGRHALLAVLEDEFEVWLATLRHVCGRTLRKGTPRAAPDARAARAPGLRAADPADLAERIALLRGVAPFAGVAIHLLGQIASEMEPLVLDPGHVLWEADEVAGHVIAIMAGVVRCREGEGDVCDVGAGSLLGLAEALCLDRYGYRSEAHGVVHALRLDGEALIDVLEDDPDAAVDLLCVIARGAVEPRGGNGGRSDGSG